MATKPGEAVSNLLTYGLGVDLASTFGEAMPNRLIGVVWQRAEVRVVLPLDVLLAPVGAVVGRVGIDPSHDADELLARDVRFAGIGVPVEALAKTGEGEERGC